MLLVLHCCNIQLSLLPRSEPCDKEGLARETGAKMKQYTPGIMALLQQLTTYEKDWQNFPHVMINVESTNAASSFVRVHVLHAVHVHGQSSS